MIKNYFQIAIRNIFKQKGYSFINIAGLALGLTCCIIIMIWIQNELSYDKYNEYGDRIYRIERSFLNQYGSLTTSFCSLAPSFVPLLKQDFQEIESIARFFRSESIVKANEKTFTEKRFFYSENEIFDILTIPFIKGNQKTALNNPNTVVISESISKKYFGDENPIGKRIQADDKLSLEITGVFSDLPENSHVHFDFIGSLITLKGMNVRDGQDYFFGTTNFSDNITQVYLRLAKNAEPKNIINRIPEFLDKYLGTRTDERGNIIKPSQYSRLELRKITDIHLYGNSANELEINGDSKYISFFSIIAGFILIIACVNYINLTTARAARRAKEVGLRKVVGAGRKPLIMQFLIESVIISAIALLFSIILTLLIIPYISALAGSGIEAGSIFHSGGILFILGIFLFTVLSSGLYPALYIAGFQPSNILRGGITRGRKGMRLRKTLVVIQFAISIILIINVGITFMQMNFLQNADLGFDKENIILIPANDAVKNNWNAFKQNLENKNDIISATLSKRAPAGRLIDAPGFTTIINGEKTRSPFSMPHNRVGFDFFKTYGMKIIAGRDFSELISTDSLSSFIINETAVKNLGL
jgi:putative ABC transport system permease protein